MPFAPGDKRINRKGRPTLAEQLIKEKDTGKPVTRRALMDRELLLLLRKLRPHVAESVLTAAKIMQNDEASHQNKLKAATVILDSYRKLVIDVYGTEVEEDPEEIQQNNAPVFSLRVVDSEEKTDK
jgi:hypothetical protein